MPLIDVRFFSQLVNNIFYKKPEHEVRIENLFKAIEKSISNSKTFNIDESVEFYDNEKSTDTDYLDTDEFKTENNESEPEYLYLNYD